jgi:hypothetical protein
LRGLLVDASAAVALAGLALAVGLWGRPGPAQVTMDLGPNTGGYLEGFAPLYEIDENLSTRWTTYHATAHLPFAVRGGPVEVSYRFARVLPETALVDVSIADRPIDRFTCRGGAYLVRRARLTALPSTPLDIRLEIDSHDRRNLGLRLDWLQVAVGSAGRLRLRGDALWLPPLLFAALFLLYRVSGHAPLTSLLLSAPWLLAWLALLWRDPFACAHLARQLALPGLIAAALLTPILRRIQAGHWVLALFVASFLIKGAGLFHPASYYPDYPNSRRFALATAAASGSLVERGRAAQTELNVAYPRVVAGKAYAFPYSPLYYMPFAVFGDAERIEGAFRYAGLLLACLEVLGVFWLGTLVGGHLRTGETGAGDRLGVLAATLSIFLPPLHSRLLLAMTATIAGHLLDVLLVAATLFALFSPRRWERWALAGLLATSSLVLYVSSLFTVTAFLCLLALLERRHAGRLLALLAPGLGLALLWLYGPFLREFLSEILPAVLAGARMSGSKGAPSLPGDAFARIPLFYGWALPLLAGTGLWLARRRVSPEAYRVLLAYAAAFVVLLLLRAFGGGLFRDLKEITFVGPLMAVSSAWVLLEISRRTRHGSVAVGLVVVGIAAFGLGKYCDYLNRYSPPTLAAREAPPPPE